MCSTIAVDERDNFKFVFIQLYTFWEHSHISIKMKIKISNSKLLENINENLWLIWDLDLKVAQQTAG